MWLGREERKGNLLGNEGIDGREEVRERTQKEKREVRLRKEGREAVRE